MNKGRKPDIVCIGAQKAGTSWLHEMLATRPDVWVPPFKELHFFDYKFIEECRRWAPWHVKKGLRQAKERHLGHSAHSNSAYTDYLEQLSQAPILNGTWYKFVFSIAQANQTCLDVTPEYSCIPDAGVAFFKRFLPDVKIIYIIRHPLDRLVSQVRMNISRQKTLPSTAAEWEVILEHPALQNRGNYKENVLRWDAFFGNDKLIYLPFGQIRTDPEEFLRKVELHCDLPAFEYKQATKKIHVTKPVQIPNHVLQRLSAVSDEQCSFLIERFGIDFFERTQ